MDNTRQAARTTRQMRSVAMTCSKDHALHINGPSVISVYYKQGRLCFRITVPPNVHIKRVKPGE